MTKKPLSPFTAFFGVVCFAIMLFIAFGGSIVPHHATNTTMTASDKEALFMTIWKAKTKKETRPLLAVSLETYNEKCEKLDDAVMQTAYKIENEQREEIGDARREVETIPTVMFCAMFKDKVISQIERAKNMKFN